MGNLCRFYWDSVKISTAEKIPVLSKVFPTFPSYCLLYGNLDNNNGWKSVVLWISVSRSSVSFRDG